MIGENTKKIVAYTRGDTDVKLTVYDEAGNKITSNDDYNSLDYNAAVAFNVYEGKTFYVEVSGYYFEKGGYSLIIQEANIGNMTCDIETSEEYTIINIKGEIASLFDTLSLQLGDTVRNFSVPKYLVNIEHQEEYEEYIIDFSSSRNELYINWDINIYLYEGSSINAEGPRCSFVKMLLNNEYLLADYYL